MSTLARWWPRPAPLRWPWQRRVDLESDHGHRPYAAWEAEFSAYARLRTGVPIEVLFGLSAYNEWGDKVHLARPPATLPAAEAFRQAELELEHVLVHFRQGAREIALYWHTWTHPVDPVNLPWPPWDQVALPGRIVRQALLEGVAGFEVPAGAEAWPGRQRDSAQWIAAAWADGVHRAREVAERPGMLERLPGPTAHGRGSPWQ